MNSAQVRSVLARVTALRKSFYLSGWNLAGDDIFCLQMRPELPFLTAGRLETDNGIPVSGRIRHSSMPSRSVRHFALMSINAAM